VVLTVSKHDILVSSFLMQINFKVNGEERSVEGFPMARLLDVLR